MKFLLKPWVIVIIILILAGGGFLIYRNMKSKQDTTTYKTSQVTKGTLTATVTGTGNMVVMNEASVSPSISGKITDLSVKVGDQVKKNDVLFKIINDTLDTNVNKAYANYLQAQQLLVDAQNSLTNAQDQLSNAETSKITIDGDSKSTDLQKTQAAQAVTQAQQKVTAAENAIPVSEINVQTALSNYNEAKKSAAERTVKASMDGTIVTVNIKNGDQIGSSNGSSSGSSAGSSSGNTSSGTSSGSGNSSTAIIIDDLGSMKAEVSLNEVDAAAVKAGQTASMTFDAISGLTLTGKVESVSAVGTESSGVVTYPAVITFDSLDDRLKPEMSLTAIITTEVKQDVLMVPSAAVKSSGDSSYVLVMKNNVPEKTTVEVGIANDSNIEITFGLNEGDTIVIQTIIANSNSSSSSNTSSKSSGSGFNSLTGGGGPPIGGLGM